MKKIITISILLAISLSASAQKPQTAEEVDVWAQNEIKSARESFQKDSIEFMRSKTEKLNQKIKEIGVEAEKQKKKIENQKKKRSTKEPVTGQGGVVNDSTFSTKSDSIISRDTTDVKRQGVDLATKPLSLNHTQQTVTAGRKTTPSNNGAVTSHKRVCKEYLKKLMPEDDISSTRQFIHNFLTMSDDISMYIQIKEDLMGLHSLLNQSGKDLMELKSFIEDLQIVSFADSVLNSPYDKAKRVDAQTKMKGIKFLTEKQRKSTLVDSLRHGLDVYYLSTSNMMDFITEITECHTRYIASETDEQREAVSKELTSSIEFDARVKNFRSVKYISDIYDKIITEILCYDNNGEFVFQKFNMDGLGEIKASLEAMRQQK